jgi:hypothetical protein
VIFILSTSSSHSQTASSNILDSSRAIDWTWVPWSIPSFTAACATQPSLAAGTANATANTTAINNAIASCDASHNVVNLPSGTYYVAGINYQGKSNVVVRGAGPNSTYINLEPPAFGCGGFVGVGVCLAGNSTYAQSPTVLPGQPNVCNWTSGYAQGTTQITLSNCGSAPPQGLILVLDQADDGADNGGIWLCSGYDSVPNPRCIQNSPNNNAVGRIVGGVQYSEEEQTIIKSVTNLGGGSYSVTISPGVFFSNIRASQNPGAWWAPSNITHDGIENLTLDHSTDTSDNIGGLMIWCYQCWFRNIRSINGRENHWDAISDVQPQIRDSYFYGNQHGGSQSYCIQMEEVSGGLVENNIIQNTTSPDIKDGVTGSVTGYNFTPYINFGNYMQGMYASHNSGSSYNLSEGNSTTSFLGDDVWGTSGLMTIFRNHANGWQPGYTNQTNPIILNSFVRGVNVIGNVLGQPGYHTQYSAYATSGTAGVFQTTQGGSTSSGSGTVGKSIYELGWTDTAGLGVCNTPPICDSLVNSTLMRWGNYDTVDATVIWDSTEASPAAVPFLNANKVPSTQSLPNSLYLSARPTWFRSVPFPAIGPDVSGGTTGMCTSGTYNGVEATSSAQCSGGTFTGSAWAGHANANPAQDCYLNVMKGPPDGSGNVLSFDANACYGSGSKTGPAPPPAPAFQVR